MFVDYLLLTHRAECRVILEADDPLRHYSVHIDFLKLFELYPDIGDSVLCDPVATLPACDQHLVTAQENLLTEQQSSRRTESIQTSGLHEGDSYVAGQEENRQRIWTVKRNVHARFYGLPVCPELHRTIFPKNCDVGCFLQVTGTVVRVTQAKMLEYRRLYVCTKCKSEHSVDANYEERYVLKAPTRCSVGGCRGVSFTQRSLVSREYCKDYQELKIQEQVNKLSMGSIPGAMWVTLEDDLVDCCKPGDDISVCGALRRRWRPPAAGRRCEAELVLQANHALVCNARASRAAAAAPDVAAAFRRHWEAHRRCPLRGRDAVLAAVCPQVYGLHLVKLALLLTVVSESQQAPAESTSSDEEHAPAVRGQCHLLLVGDPGTGKSQLLRAGAELAPRSVFTSGTGSTRAGLTCAALKEEGEWMLEAGALVLADGGACCVDEVGQLREHDRAGIHEAMEQQTVSVAKAGIVCKLNTRCAVIGACNPKGHYQTDQPLSANVSLGTPLLSRFDLIFILLDTKNERWDELVSSYILFGGDPTAAATTSTARILWTNEKLQMYMSWVGGGRAVMSPSADAVLRTYYMRQRGAEQRDPARTTVRMLDSLVRLSQAHCRLMCRERVTPMDAITAVSLVDLSMQSCALRDAPDALHSTFPSYPDLHYLLTARDLLARLHLPEVWKEELLHYSQLLDVDCATLESEIDKRSHRLFAKNDAVEDDVPLSSSLVTSSYFNKKPEKEMAKTGEGPSEVEMEKVVDINTKLAATLKKHSSLNKVSSQPTLKVQNIKVGKKRKRKEVIIENEILKESNSNKSIKNKNYRNKKEQANKQCNKKKTVIVDSDSSEESLESRNILNHVPSVNDIFVDLDIHMSFEDKEVDNPSENRSLVAPSPVEGEPPQLEKPITSVNKTIKIHTNGSLIENKLEKFKFDKKCDLSKFYEPNVKIEHPVSDDPTNSKPVKIAKLSEDHKMKSFGVHSSQGSSVGASQISMFESSDCEVDLDL